MKYKELANRLHSLRLENGLTQKEVAFLANISIVAYSNIERGISVPKYDNLQAIAKALNTNANTLLTEADSEFDTDYIKLIKNSKHILYEKIISNTKDWFTRRKILEELAGFNFDECKQNYKNFLSSYYLDSNNAIDAAEKFREFLELETKPIPNIITLMEKSGIKVLPYKAMTLSFTSALIWINKEPIVVFNCWEEIPVEQWIFSVVQALGWLLLNTSDNTSIVFLKDEHNQDINIFAEYFLLPDSGFNQMLQMLESENTSLKIIYIKYLFKVGWELVAKRYAIQTQQDLCDIVEQFHKFGIKVSRTKEPNPLKPCYLFQGSNPQWFLTDVIAHKAWQRNFFPSSYLAQLLNVSQKEAEYLIHYWKI